MFPGKFDYERPETVGEATAFLARHEDDDTELLAGGHSLIPTMKTGLASVDVVVDISRIDALRGIESDGDTHTVGALTPYATIESATRLREDCPVVTDAAAEIGDVQVRNMGTIGGNVAHADPTSDMPASVLATDAVVHVCGPDGDRSVAAADFFEGMFSTALDEDELLTRIEIPADGGNRASAYVKRPNPASGYAIVGVGAAVELDDDVVASARVATTGSTDHAVRLTAVEEALVGDPLTTDSMVAAAEQATDDLGDATMMDDDYASSEFRAGLLEGYTERALQRAAERL